MIAGKKILVAALAGAASLMAGTAHAQYWAYDSHMADRAYRSADIREHEARRDQHAANVAAHHGDYAAAEAYAHAADVQRARAYRDARFAAHENREARWDYRHAGWGYWGH
ncbi:hypothetical protein [Sphingobium sp. Sx8-8]|uniref:hypothetical protein n=1 Tax=Sphingobium sp. Sx8-8 TaxID=2933617 RepID=UPI001F5AD8D3|nr:hypothetical protein [Sphingobium sp. Sx8-8]